MMSLDTAFMFVMGGLVLIKVMQHRHPDLHTHSSAAFLAFSLILLLTFIGIVSHTHTHTTWN